LLAFIIPAVPLADLDHLVAVKRCLLDRWLKGAPGGQPVGEGVTGVLLEAHLL
jgi:hypothetical protein